ncbi:hypothetical protein OAC75_05160, partial [Pseudomonadales bacterium]|nr:hypothetical protein [Pseudomonadales bacterium]
MLDANRKLERKMFCLGTSMKSSAFYQRGLLLLKILVLASGLMLSGGRVAASGEYEVIFENQDGWSIVGRGPAITFGLHQRGYLYGG